MRDSFLLLISSAALLLTACGGARPEVRSAPPAAHPVEEYRPLPVPPVDGVVVSTGEVVVGAVAVATQPAVNVVPHEPQPPIAADADFLLIVSEAVGGPDEDLGSYTKVFVDGKLLGQTQMAPKSVDKKWGMYLQPGNHLFRFEKWDETKVGPWTALDEQWQQAERFIRIEPGTRAVARLKFYDGGRGHALAITRESSATAP